VRASGHVTAYILYWYKLVASHAAGYGKLNRPKRAFLGLGKAPYAIGYRDKDSALGFRQGFQR